MGRCGYILRTIKLNELLRVLGVKEKEDRFISLVTCHSHLAHTQSVFVAIEGSRESGYDYVEEVLKKGAIVISEREDERCIQVKDARSAYALLQHAMSYQPSLQLKMIGVCGTNGKSTTSMLIQDMLHHQGIKSALIGSDKAVCDDVEWVMNNTTPESELLVEILLTCLQKGVYTVVMEMSSMALKMKRLHGVMFDVVVFTQISEDHVSEHGSLEDYIDSKQLALSYIKPHGVFVFNRDDAILQRFANKFSGLCISYGKQSYQFHISRIIEGTHCTSFKLNQKTYTTTLRSQVNVYNLVAAMVCGFCMDLKWDQIEEWSRRVKEIPGRFELISENPMIFVDYAHTINAMESSLRYFRSIKQGELIVVFGCGGRRDRTKRPAMGRIAERYADVLILTNDNPRDEDPCRIIADIVAGCKKQHEVTLNRSNAIKNAMKYASNNDIIIVVGKGNEQNQLLNDQFINQSDKQIILSLLQGED